MYTEVLGLKMPNEDGFISDPPPRTCLTSKRNRRSSSITSIRSQAGEALKRHKSKTFRLAGQHAAAPAMPRVGHLPRYWHGTFRYATSSRSSDETASRSSTSILQEVR